MKKAPAPPSAPLIGTVNGGNVVISVHGSAKIAKEPRSRTPDRWREELLAAISEKAAELEMTEEQVRTLAGHALREKGIVLSLEKLKSRDLAKIYQVLAELKRPALD